MLKAKSQNTSTTLTKTEVSYEDLYVYSFELLSLFDYLNCTESPALGGAKCKRRNQGTLLFDEDYRLYYASKIETPGILNVIQRKITEKSKRRGDDEKVLERGFLSLYPTDLKTLQYAALVFANIWYPAALKAKITKEHKQNAWNDVYKEYEDAKEFRWFAISVEKTAITVNELSMYGYFLENINGEKVPQVESFQDYKVQYRDIFHFFFYAYLVVNDKIEKLQESEKTRTRSRRGLSRLSLIGESKSIGRKRKSLRDYLEQEEEDQPKTPVEGEVLDLSEDFPETKVRESKSENRPPSFPSSLEPLQSFLPFLPEAPLVPELPRPTKKNIRKTLMSQPRLLAPPAVLASPPPAFLAPPPPEFLPEPPLSKRIELSIHRPSYPIRVKREGFGGSRKPPILKGFGGRNNPIVIEDEEVPLQPTTSPFLSRMQRFQHPQSTTPSIETPLQQTISPEALDIRTQLRSEIPEKQPQEETKEDIKEKSLIEPTLEITDLLSKIILAPSQRVASLLINQRDKWFDKKELESAVSDLNRILDSKITVDEMKKISKDRMLRSLYNQAYSNPTIKKVRGSLLGDLTLQEWIQQIPSRAKFDEFLLKQDTGDYLGDRRVPFYHTVLVDLKNPGQGKLVKKLFDKIDSKVWPSYCMATLQPRHFTSRYDLDSKTNIPSMCFDFQKMIFTAPDAYLGEEGVTRKFWTKYLRNPNPVVILIYFNRHIWNGKKDVLTPILVGFALGMTPYNSKLSKEPETDNSEQEKKTPERYGKIFAFCINHATYENIPTSSTSNRPANVLYNAIEQEFKTRGVTRIVLDAGPVSERFWWQRGFRYGRCETPNEFEKQVWCDGRTNIKENVDILTQEIEMYKCI